MHKQTHYLWRSDFSSQDELETERKNYGDQGFRVVTFWEGDSANDLHESIRALLENHWKEPTAP